MITLGIGLITLWRVSLISLGWQVQISYQATLDRRMGHYLFTACGKVSAKVIYMYSGRFVQDMVVKVLQNNAIEGFKRYYYSVNVLLIDDIQFFENKEGSQEEFVHTFNALFEGNQQIILTSNRYPKEISGVGDKFKSRF